MIGPCSLGCAGWFIQPAGERHAGCVMRCDECARFEDDEAAEAYVNTVVRARNARTWARQHRPRLTTCPTCGTTLDPSPVAQLTGEPTCPTCTERDRLRDERDTQLNEERD